MKFVFGVSSGFMRNFSFMKICKSFPRPDIHKLFNNNKPHNSDNSNGIKTKKLNIKAVNCFADILEDDPKVFKLKIAKFQSEYLAFPNKTSTKTVSSSTDVAGKAYQNRNIFYDPQRSIKSL